MPELVTKCPRCRANQMTFEVLHCVQVRQDVGAIFTYEAFCRCRNCDRSSIFVVRTNPQNTWADRHGGPMQMQVVSNNYDIVGAVTLKDNASEPPPEYLPNNIKAIFEEGASCLAANCFNAAATMFRLCIDLATKSMMPPVPADLPSKIRRNLGLRLPWLFDNGKLPEALRELADCIKEDGNDGAHEGTLGRLDAEDVRDFTYVLLQRIYTEPAQLGLAKERRNARRAS